MEEACILVVGQLFSHGIEPHSTMGSGDGMAALTVPYLLSL